MSRPGSLALPSGRVLLLINDQRTVGRRDNRSTHAAYVP